MRHIPIAQIADRLHPRTNVVKAMALLEAYFDESGINGPSITAIAGYVASRDAWGLLETLWQEELDTPVLSDNGVRIFHMNHAIVGRGEYENVPHPDRMSHILRSSEILRDADIQAVGIWVDNNDWRATVSDAAFLTAFPDPYAFCFDRVVKLLREWALRHAGGELVSPMFGLHQKYSPRALARYDAQTWYRDALASLAFDYPERIIPLQAADFVAHQVRHDAHHLGYEELTLANIDFTLWFANATAKNGVDLILGYGSAQLANAVRKFNESGKV